MNRQPPHWLAVLTAALLLSASASTSSWAGSGAIQRASIDETFEAGSAELIGVAGRVSIRLHDGHDIRLRAEGPKRWISDLVRRTEAGVLVVNAGSLTGSVGGSAVTIASGPGARAETRIGSLSITSDGGVAIGRLGGGPARGRAVRSARNSPDGNRRRRRMGHRGAQGAAGARTDGRRSPRRRHDQRPPVGARRRRDRRWPAWTATCTPT